MSGGSIGGSTGNNSAQTYQTSSSSNTSTAPPAIEGILKTMAGDLTNYYLQNPNAPAYYPGATVAPPSPMTQSAIQTLFGVGSGGSQALTPFFQNLTDTANGRYLDLSRNPYLQGAIAYSQQPVIDAFNKQVLPGIASAFEGSGRTPESGNLAGNAVQTATDTLARNLAGAATTAGASAYQQERGDQLQAASLFPQLQGAQLRDVGAMGQAGQAADAYQQALSDANVARYNYQQTAEPNWITNLAQELQAIYPGGQTLGSGSASGYSTGAYNNLGARFDLSDRRLKTDVQPVGRLHDGQTVYSYRFRGNPRTELGLIAQEVEKRRPDAVRRHPSGFKMVDYRKATAPRMAPRAAAPSGGLL
jgi:hypothetical protein